MSGFAVALRHRGGIAPCRGRLEALLEALDHRGPGGKTLKLEDPAALAQLHERSATADHSGAGPWRLRPDGPILCGDLAILDGPALAAASGSAYRGDAQAILSAYDRWGEELAPHLEGEFAFVIWDPAARRLLALRDRFGVKPLAYRASADALWLASEPGALDRDAAGSSSDVDPRWIAQFLRGEDEDAALTAFAEVHRLLPGHRLICEAEQLRIDPWWRLEPRVLSETEAPEALAEALGRAVRDRGGEACATLLSGGLDSSSITCLAARQSASPVRAVSLRYTDMPELDEGPYIDAVRRCGNIEGIDARARSGATFDGLGQLFAEQGYPVFAPNHAMLHQTYAAVAETGARIVLDGHGGDEVIGTGAWYFSELAHEKRWRTLWRGLREQRAVTDADFPVVEMMIGALRMHGPRGVRPFLRKGSARRDSSAAAEIARLPARQGDDPEGMAAFRHDHLAPFTRHHARILLNPGTAHAFEMLDRLAAHQRISARFPFYDRRVVEITLGQPTQAKFSPGQPRLLLRRAMAGILPEEVRLRPGKMNFMPSVIAGFRPAHRARLRQLEQVMPAYLQPHVDLQGFRAACVRFDAEPECLASTGALLRVLWLDEWLSARARSGGRLERG